MSEKRPEQEEAEQHTAKSDSLCVKIQTALNDARKMRKNGAPAVEFALPRLQLLEDEVALRHEPKEG